MSEVFQEGKAYSIYKVFTRTEMGLAFVPTGLIDAIVQDAIYELFGGREYARMPRGKDYILKISVEVRPVPF